MKKIVTSAILVLIVASMVIGIVAAENSISPAPESHDGDPEGSGFEQPNYQNEDNPGMGPAPNSSDGVPDGSGF